MFHSNNKNCLITFQITILGGFNKPKNNFLELKNVFVTNDTTVKILVE